MNSFRLHSYLRFVLKIMTTFVVVFAVIPLFIWKLVIVGNIPNNFDTEKKEWLTDSNNRDFEFLNVADNPLRLGANLFNTPTTKSMDTRPLELAYFTFMNVSEKFPDQKLDDSLPKSKFYAKVEHTVNSWKFPASRQPRKMKDAMLDKYVMLVTSAPSNFELRQRVRQTWGGDANRTNDVMVVFVLGGSWKKSLMNNIVREADMHQDLLILDFIDSYENLTAKTMMALKWATSFCPLAKYFIKTDDDILYNVKVMMKNLNNAFVEGIQAFGFRLLHQSAFRKGKWSTPREQYPYFKYPTYVSGHSYVMTPDVASILVMTSERVPLLRMEDVYVTGMLAIMCGLEFVHLDGWLIDRMYAQAADDTVVSGKYTCAWYRNNQIYMDIYTRINNT